MDLYIIRHAEAEPRGPGVSEEARQLTPKGEHQFRAASKALKEMGVKFDRMIFSPWCTCWCTPTGSTSRA